MKALHTRTPTVKGICVMILAACSLFCEAQTKGTATLIGYVQDVLPGVRSGEVAEEGSQPATRSGSRKNYFIYMISTSRIFPAEMWIQGEPYSVSVEPVSAPVEYRSAQSENVQPIVLVPATSGKVIRLTPAPAIEEKLTATGRKLSTDNALVVVYKENGRFYYQVLAELKQLPAAAMQ